MNYISLISFGTIKACFTGMLMSEGMDICFCHPKNVQKHVDGYAVYVFTLSTLLKGLDCERENRSMMMTVMIQMQPKSFVSTDPVCTSTNDKALHSPIYAIYGRGADNPGARVEKGMHCRKVHPKV